MSDVYFTTNPSDFAKLEGLYVSERNPAGFIRGRDLNVIAMATQCVRGPLTPTEITSSGQFTSIFGARDTTANGTGGTLIGNGWAALLNKPFGKLIVRRVAAAAAVKGTLSRSNVIPTAIVRFDASSVGAWGNNVTIAIEAATDADANHFNVRAAYLGEEQVFQNLDCSGTNDNLTLKLGSNPERWIDAVKLAAGRPINAVAAALASGADGTIAATDYITGMQEIAVYPGAGVCLVPEGVPTGSGGIAAYHSALVVLAAATSDRIYLTWGQAHGQTVATEVAQVASQITTRSDRIVYCYNSAYTYDPATGAEIQTAPHVWLASILSQVDVDVHAGSFETLAYLAGISRLTNVALTRAELISLRDAGITTLERNTDGPQFRSAVTTSLISGKTEIARRRECDYLQLSAGDALRYYVKRKNTPETRAGMAGELTAFSNGLKAEGRIIEDFEISSDPVNTAASRARSEEHLLWRVKLLGHILSLVLETEIGTGTVIERAA
jgi:hypothetical protein